MPSFRWKPLIIKDVNITTMTFVDEEMESRFQESLDSRRRESCKSLSVFYFILMMIRIILDIRQISSPLLSVAIVERALIIISMLFVSFCKHDLLSGLRRSTIVLLLFFLHEIVINVLEEYILALHLSDLNISSTIFFWGVSLPMIVTVFCSSNRLLLPISITNSYVLFKNFWYQHIDDDEEEEITTSEAIMEISGYVITYLIVSTTVSPCVINLTYAVHPALQLWSPSCIPNSLESREGWSCSDEGQVPVRNKRQSRHWKFVSGASRCHRRGIAVGWELSWSHTSLENDAKLHGSTDRVEEPRNELCPNEQCWFRQASVCCCQFGFDVSIAERGD